MEICSQNNLSVPPEETVQRMIGLGYEAMVVIEGKAVPWQAHDDRHANYYFRPTLT